MFNLFGKWIVEDCVIQTNPNGTRTLVLGYRNSKTKKTQIWEYWLGDDGIFLKPEFFLGYDERHGIRTDNLYFDW